MKKIISAVLACALAAGLTACTFKSPETVGSIGETTFTGGRYLMSQMSAVNDAMDLAESGASVKDMLSAELTLEDGTTQKGSDYVAQRTLEDLQYIAAVESRFASLGLEMDEASIAGAKQQADQLWNAYSDTYTANGVGQATVQASVETAFRAGLVFDELYGNTPDAECRAWLAENAAAGFGIQLPLINTQTYAYADDEAEAGIKDLAEKARDALAGGQSAADAADEFAAEAYALLDMEYTAGQQGDGKLLFMPASLESLGEENKNTLMALKNGEAAVVNLGTSLLVFLRADAEEVYDLESIKTGYSLLSEMKGEEFTEAMVAEGAALSNALDSKAMAAYKAENTVI